jgi:hypothetical protein
MNEGQKPSPLIWIKTGSLLFIALLLHLLGYFPSIIENWYSTGIYKGISYLLRAATKWVPFSVGDVLYILFIISLIVGLIHFIIRLVGGKLNRHSVIPIALKLFGKILYIYIIFRLLWGLNYDRLGIAHQLKLSTKEYETEEVIQLTNRLIDSLNACRLRLSDTVLPEPPVDSIFRMAGIGYSRLSDQYFFLNYTQRSLKPSLFTPIADWLSFTGYYNPFSGEGQVRTDIPRVLIPFVSCHEIGHQLGYASESEANFVGFLAALSTNDPYFRYSALNELFTYAQREELFMLALAKDSVRFESVIQQNRERLDTLVRKDRKEIRTFFQQRSNKISPAFNDLYERYLKANDQAEGLRSYDEVVGLLIAYIKKHEKI